MDMKAAKRRSGFADHPGYRVDFEPTAKRIRVIAGDRVLADSSGVHILRETGHTPVYYFPRGDIAWELLQPSDKTSYCPFKGDATYWHIDLSERRIEDAVWSYRNPFEEVAPIKDTLAFYWHKMDHWYEEDEEVFVHARDPHVRLDVVTCKRPLKVVVSGETVAESGDYLCLFETGLPVRYYLKPEDVAADLLTPSETTSRCPYKGQAKYHNLTVKGETHSDLVWSYPEPLAEVGRIRGHLAFYQEGVEAIILDGQTLPKPVTKRS